MLVITIDNAVSGSAVAQIKALVAEEIRCNPDYNGASYKITRGDCTSLNDERPSGIQLLRAIHGQIYGYDIAPDDDEYRGFDAYLKSRRKE